MAVAGNAVSAPGNVEKTSNGVLIQVGQEQVELAAANTNTFRLSIVPSDTTWATSSTFLADTNADNPVAWQMAKHRRMIGVRTASGELLMNPKSGEWTLENSHGKILIPKHNIGDFVPRKFIRRCLAWLG